MLEVPIVNEFWPAVFRPRSQQHGLHWERFFYVRGAGQSLWTCQDGRTATTRQVHHHRVLHLRHILRADDRRHQRLHGQSDLQYTVRIRHLQVHCLTTQTPGRLQGDEHGRTQGPQTRWDYWWEVMTLKLNFSQWEPINLALIGIKPVKLAFRDSIISNYMHSKEEVTFVIFNEVFRVKSSNSNRNPLNLEFQLSVNDFPMQIPQWFQVGRRVDQQKAAWFERDLWTVLHTSLNYWQGISFFPTKSHQFDHTLSLNYAPFQDFYQNWPKFKKKKKNAKLHLFFFNDTIPE